MADEPTLSEISNMPSSADLGTAGMTAYVPTMRDVNARVFEAAKTKAAYEWDKYQSFLQQYNERVKSGQAALNQDLAPNDRVQLQNQMADVFNEIAKDPKNNIAGKGVFDIDQKLNSLVSNAATSRQDNDFDKEHRKFLIQYNGFNTEPNKAKVEGFLKQPLGTRQPYLFDQPDPLLDAEKLSQGIYNEKDVTHTYTDPTFIGPDGKPGQGYIREESGTEFNPKAFMNKWNLQLSDNPDIAKGAKNNYDNLPPAIKDYYDKNGGVKAYFQKLGEDHLKAIIPDGSYTPTAQGNYRFGKTSKISPDSNYLGKEKLGETIRHNKAEEAKQAQDLAFKKFAFSVREGDKKDKKTADGYSFGNLAEVLDYDIAKNVESKITSKNFFSNSFADGVYNALKNGDKEIELPSSFVSKGLQQKLVHGQTENYTETVNGNEITKTRNKVPTADKFTISLNDAGFEIKAPDGTWHRSIPNSSQQMKNLIKIGNGRLKINTNRIEGGNINEQRGNIVVTGNDISSKEQKKGQPEVLNIDEDQ